MPETPSVTHSDYYNTRSTMYMYNVHVSVKHTLFEQSIRSTKSYQLTHDHNKTVASAINEIHVHVHVQMSAILF